jgi:uncharacterized membrane protein
MTAPKGQELSSPISRLPSPAQLAGYEKLVPNIGERLVKLIEAQHAAEIEDARAQRRENRRGQLCGLTVGCFGLGSSVAIMWRAPNGAGATAASVIGGATLVSMVIAFVIGRRVKSGQMASDRGEKRELRSIEPTEQR